MVKKFKVNEFCVKFVECGFVIIGFKFVLVERFEEVIV